MEIAQYLSTKELLTCIRVSRTCEAHFTPALWTTLPLEKMVVKKNKSPPPIQWNADSVRHLSIKVSTFSKGLSSFQTNVLRECRNVKFFQIEATPVEEDLQILQFEDKVWTVLTKFVKENQGICRVDLGNGNINYSKDFIQALAMLPALEHFKAEYIVLQGRQLGQLLRLLPPDSGTNHVTALKSFSTSGAWMEGVEGLKRIAADKTLLTLTSFNLTGAYNLTWNEQVDLICRFPKLEILEWFYIDRKSCTEEFRANDFVTKIFKKCPRIKKLAFLSTVRMSPKIADYQNNINDKHLETIFRSAPVGLERINVNRSKFGPLAFKSLKSRPFFSTLKELDLDHCYEFTSQMAVECLESCSGLTKFVVVEISAADIARSAKKQGSKKWKCRNMEYLKAHITQLGSVDPPHANASQKVQDQYKKSLQLHKTVLGQLSIMTHLTHLDVGRSKIPSIFGSDEESLYSSEEDDEESLCSSEEDEEDWEDYEDTRDMNPIQTMLMKQIRKAMEREFLGLGIDRGSTGDKRAKNGYLTLRGDAGLNILATWSQLRYLNVQDLKQSMSSDDAHWIQKNWPRLHTIEGELHSQAQKSQVLKAIALGDRIFK
ncbi:hypothetical protein BGZ52_001250 [Haplosporangium bisporale]|nr:hypothetical protein BGZ52_001250 [Haplosporangium bisporale]